MQITILRAWLIALLLAFLAGCGLMNGGPASTVKAFYKEVETGKLTEAVDHLTGPMVQMMGKDKLKAAFADQSEKIKQQGGIRSIGIESEEVNGETASVVVLVTYGNGSVERAKNKLVKGEKGHWMIVVDL